MFPVIARYREFEPCEALRPHVRAFFTFTAPPEEMPEINSAPYRRNAREVICREGDPFWSALFADGHVSVIFCFGPGYRVDRLWVPSAGGFGSHVIGAMTAVRMTSPGNPLLQIGAYLRAGKARLFTGVPACELTDRIVALEDLWGFDATALEADLFEAQGDTRRIDRLESAFLRRAIVGQSQDIDKNLQRLSASILRLQGQLTVKGMAEQAGVSRQYLTRAFRDHIGVTPKMYCRLARFQAALAYASGNENVDWADAAVRMGYTDQSHMIAEFREFSGLAPTMLTRQRCFHPFRESRSEVA